MERSVMLSNRSVPLNVVLNRAAEQGAQFLFVDKPFTFGGDQADVLLEESDLRKHFLESRGRWHGAGIYDLRDKGLPVYKVPDDIRSEFDLH